MNINLYSIQDTMVGFNAPFTMVNDEVAKREYQHFLEKNINAPDMRLFKIGEMDDQTGEIKPIVPVCIMGGGENGEA